MGLGRAESGGEGSSSGGEGAPLRARGQPCIAVRAALHRRVGLGGMGRVPRPEGGAAGAAASQGGGTLAMLAHGLLRHTSGAT